MNGYFQISFILIALLGGFTAGWKVHEWKTLAAEEKTAVIAEKQAGQGEANIIRVNQEVTKDLKSEKKASCVNQPIPASLSKLLH